MGSRGIADACVLISVLDSWDIFSRTVVARMWFGTRGSVGVTREVTDCVLVRDFDLTASSDSEREILSVSSPISQLSCGVLQTLSYSEKRSASGTLLCEQSTRARMSVERPPVKRTPVKAVPECLKNRAPTAAQRNAIAANSDVPCPTVGSAARIRRSTTPALAHRCRCKSARVLVCAGTCSDSVTGGLREKK